MNVPLEKSIGFTDMDLLPELHKTLNDIGYFEPTPIQSLTIPPILEGRDVIGQAQTGTGKTAAFALPLLTKINLKSKDIQVLVMTPTRELAIQVSESFKKYGSMLKGLNVTPIYGGQSYTIQLRQLQRGPQVIVGTPGRIMDHLRQKNLKFDTIRYVVLDEGDEMLKMGFQEDIEWILEQVPAQRQMTLFSATMPEPIRRIAKKYQNDPLEITTQMKVKTAETIRQRYQIVREQNKFQLLQHILEIENYRAVLVFVRTKNAVTELSDRLIAKGIPAAPLSGDLSQAQRERTITQLKSGVIKILIATDVAARGLDVDRISHVINYDIPYDGESYIHRVGRTGRAGETGEAILFVTPGEKRLLAEIERRTNLAIPVLELPTLEEINFKRVEGFKAEVLSAVTSADQEKYTRIIKELLQENNINPKELAAGLLHIIHSQNPIFLENAPVIQEQFDRRGRENFRDNLRDRDRDRDRGRDSRDRDRDRGDSRRREPARRMRQETVRDAEVPMETFRIEVGAKQGVKPGQIVGAIANEAGIAGHFIGHIGIFPDHSTVDLPAGIPANVFQTLKRVWVSGKQMNISRM